MHAAQKVIGPELLVFEQKFAGFMRSSAPLLDRIMRFIIRRKGKQLRPMFVFLAARIAGNDQPISDQVYRAASLIELLHTATLVHDDVVDNAMVRRSFFSINALWKNKIAVLVGDYLLSKGLLLSIDHGDFRVLQITSQAVKDMSEGELLQMEKARRLDISEEVYFQIIRAKTASLLASACGSGAWSASEDEDATARMRLFGEKVGVAFQIKDDLFDYGADNIGKPTGIDIKEKKMTLPLIHALQQVDASTRRAMIYTVKNRNTDRKAVNEVIAQVVKAGGIEYAAEAMRRYIREAIDTLHTFPKTEARDAMEELVHYAIERKY